MILELTAERLKAYGFEEYENIERSFVINRVYDGYASSTDGKIYTEIDAMNKLWSTQDVLSFPIKMSEFKSHYFKFKLTRYLHSKQKDDPTTYNEPKLIERFKQLEIDHKKEIIAYQKEKFKNWAYKLNDIEVYVDYIEWVKDYVVDNNAAPKKQGNKSTTIKSPETLQELFIEIKYFNSAIKALKTVKAINNINENLIGSKIKGVMQVWIGILRTDRQYLKHIHDGELTILLNKFFINLNLSEKTDGKHFRNRINKTASNLYRAKLVAAIR